MSKHLLDTTILISHLRGFPGYRPLLTRLSQEGALGISPISRFEVIQGMRKHEQKATLSLLDSLLLYPFDAGVADLGGEFVRQWRSRGITLSGPDALIAATACLQQAILITTNVKDFPMPELQVSTPDAQGNLKPVLAGDRKG